MIKNEDIKNVFIDKDSVYMTDESKDFNTCINKLSDEIKEVLQLLSHPKVSEIEQRSSKSHKLHINTIIKKMDEVISEAIRYQRSLEASKNSTHKENFNDMIQLVKTMVINCILGKKLITLEDANYIDNLERLRNTLYTCITVYLILSNIFI